MKRVIPFCSDGCMCGVFSAVLRTETGADSTADPRAGKTVSFSDSLLEKMVRHVQTGGQEFAS